MLLRLRWFAFGVMTTLAAVVTVVRKARRLRERLTPAALAKASALVVADSLEGAGRRLAPPSGASPAR